MGLLTEVGVDNHILCQEAHRAKSSAFRSVPELQQAIMVYLDAHNADPKPFVWTKSPGQILEKIARAKQVLES